MTSRDFCYWLMGCLELGGGDGGLSAAQVATIKRHLSLVFAHEIDPQAGGAEVQAAFDAIHAGPAVLPFPGKGDARPRC